MFNLIRSMVASLALCLALMAPVHGQEGIDENWRPPSPTSSNYKSVTITDSIKASDTFSRLWGQGTNTFYRYVCKSVDDVNCSTAEVFDFQSVLPVCTNSTQVNCVESVSSGSTANTLVDGSFISYTLSEHPNNFVADKRIGLIENSNPSIWSLPGSPHGAGNQYTVVVGVRGYVSTNMSSTGERIIQSADSTIYGFLVPTKLVVDAGSAMAKCVQAANSELKAGVIANTRCTGSELPVNPALNIKCTFSFGSDDDCLAPVKFPENTQYRISVRLAVEPLAWIHGRMTDPSISIESDQVSGEVRMTVTALPARVPVVHHGADWATATESTKDWWRNQAKKCDSSQDCFAGGTNPEAPFADIENSEISMSAPPYGNFPIDVIRGLKDDTKDTAATQQSIWSFRTLPGDELVGANRCIKDGKGVKGVVTTNATAYVQGPPVFEDGSLNYQVASLHKLSSGDVFRGTYSLIVRSDVARCLYGFTDAPIKAEVSVVSDGDQSSFVTTSSRELDGWFNLNVANFTFSTPSIKVRLSQEEAVVSKPSDTSSDETSRVQQSTAKKRVTCVKGAKKVRVLASAPKCPKGFKLRKG